MPRLFIAIDLPEALKDHLAALQDPALSVRWTPPPRYHLTVRFIGEVSTETQAMVEQALGSIRATSFLIQAQGLGVFPSLRRPRVLFMSVSSPPALLHLHESISHALKSIGLAPDTKPFRPHVTLARIKRATEPEIRAYLRANPSFSQAPFSVTRYHLYKSTLLSSGALHEPQRTFYLLS